MSRDNHQVHSWSKRYALAGSLTQQVAQSCCSGGQLEGLTWVQGNGREQVERGADVVARHHHLHSLRQRDGPRDVGSPHIELRNEDGAAPSPNS